MRKAPPKDGSAKAKFLHQTRNTHVFVETLFNAVRQYLKKKKKKKKVVVSSLQLNTLRF